MLKGRRSVQPSSGLSPQPQPQPRTIDQLLATHQLVLGAGEVGSAIAAILQEAGFFTVLVDKGESQPAGFQGAVMHVCFPYSDEFESQVNGYVLDYLPSLVVIHSTVPVGTSTRLAAVHSPVMGRHPNLRRDMEHYRKVFGGPRAAEAAAYFELTSLSIFTLPRSEETEAGKLWQTLQYGWLIALEKECFRFCEANGLDPKIVYNGFNSFYNRGMHTKGESLRLILPIMTHMDGPIGGHCVIPNTELLETRLASALSALNETWPPGSDG